MHNLKSNYIRLSSDKRLHNCEKPLIALTGGIASGKSSAAEHLKELGVPLIDADRLIHSIYKNVETKRFIQNLIPEVTEADEINFKSLRKVFFEDKKLKSSIENYLYSKLPQAFTNKALEFEHSKYNYIVYDIPLLFEKELQSQFDLNVLIYCPPQTQLERLLKRDRITQAEAENILKQQKPIEEKAKLAEFIIKNTSDISSLNKKVEDFLTQVTIP